jgi:hypothetical protein
MLKLHGFDEEAITNKQSIICSICHTNCHTNCHTKCHTKCHNIPEKNTKHICPRCKNSFASRQGKSKHLKYHCTVKDTSTENELQKNYDALVIQVEEMVNKMALLETKTKSKTTNKILNNNTIINNINLNNYGSINSEDFNYLTKKVFAKLLETPLTAIPKLIGIKYFNEKHPENHNIKITNIHDKFAKIYKDKKWLISNKKDIIFSPKVNGISRKWLRRF